MHESDQICTMSRPQRFLMIQGHWYNFAVCYVHYFLHHNSVHLEKDHYTLLCIKFKLSGNNAGNDIFLFCCCFKLILHYVTS